MNLRFDQPDLLWLALLIPPLLFIGWRSTVGFDPARRISAMVLRAALLGGLIVALAAPRSEREHDQLTVIGLIDVSGSVRRFADLPTDATLGSRSTLEYLRQWFREAADVRRPDDRVGLIVFDGQAIAISTPTRGDYVDDNIDIRRREGTNIADAIELGLAMFPADTARRLVLVTDGNETAGEALDTARRAAGSLDATTASGARIPIDVLPIAYNINRDVQLVRLDAPPSAQPGQTITVRMVLESTQPVSGRLILMREGRAVDLNGDAPGTSRRITVPSGTSVQRAAVTLDESPVNRFEAIFEPDGVTSDAIVENNVARSFTVTPSKGSILIVDRNATGGQDHPLQRILRDADVPVESIPPARFPVDLLSMQAYDLIVLDNVPAYDLAAEQHELIKRYVEDLGGGFIMVGGENGFGAGGWNGTTVEEILPLELDPPRELRLPTAALVLIIDKSGSMSRPVAGARSTQQEVANEGAALAIESLRSESLVAVLAFDYGVQEVVPLQRNVDAKSLASNVRRINADGGTNIALPMERALEMLRDLPVAKKRVVCLSDGQSDGADPRLVAQRMAAANIKVSAIAVGDDADVETLRAIAEIGDGEFYEVRDPQALPRVLVDSVQVINKPLIKEVPFRPDILATGSTLTEGMATAPELRGLVITTPKPDPRAIIEMTHSDEGADPLLAHWQVGLGRVAAFTSDIGRTWSTNWEGWQTGDRFWLQLTRMMTRPPQSRETELLVDIRGDRLEVTLEAANAEGFIDHLRVDGTVYRPDGEAVPVRLRQEAPGRYVGDIDAPIEGNYIVAVTPRSSGRRLAPSIGGASRTTSPEFRRMQSNVSLLDEIAQMTDGRVLDVSDATAVNLYDRAQLPRRVSSIPAWPIVMWIVLSCLILDVATRRIAWDIGTINRLAARAYARIRPAAAARRATVTLSSLREASDRLDARLDAQSEGVAKLEGKKGRRGVPPRRFVKQKKKDDDAVDNASTPATAAKGPVKVNIKSPEPPQDDQADDGSTETTSGLLAAKRRARRQMDD
ncbi:MAG: VWA domain-containing protein [Planctomycetota bacterium]